MFVFASSDKTGEEKACVCVGLDASLSLVLLAKYILSYLIQQEH